jgi:hypothetical protein
VYPSASLAGKGIAPHASTVPSTVTVRPVSLEQPQPAIVSEVR